MVTYYKTLAEIRSSIRRRLGWPSADTFVSDDEIEDMIRASQRDLVNLLVSVHQGDYNVFTATAAVAAGATFTATGQTGTLLGPILRVLRVSVDIDGVSVPFRRLGWDNEARNESNQPWTRGTDLRYRFTKYTPNDSDIIHFQPPPDTAQVLSIVYVSGPGTLSLSTSVNFVGHDEYLILDGMIKCLDMEESDTSQIERRKAQYIAALEQTYTPLDIGAPAVISDARNRDADIWGRR